MILDYEKLTADYQNSLFTMLRGFGAAAGFLDTWVPDADPIKSICNMLDAAAVAGHNEIAIFIGHQTAKQLDQISLAKAAEEFGHISIKPENNGLLLTVAAIDEGSDREDIVVKEASQPDKYVRLAADAGRSWNRDLASRPAIKREITQTEKVGAFYAKAVALLSGQIAYEGDVAETKGCVVAASEYAGAKLMLLVNSNNHLIKKARRHGATAKATRVLLDRLCSMIQGMPIQEASDHGVIRLEFELRDKSMPRPVLGIVTPEAADIAFLLPLKLVREAMADYRRKTGYGQTKNTYDQSPSKEWLAMSDDQRRSRLAEVIAKVARENSFPAGEATVTAIEFDVRVVMRLQGSLALADRQRLLMKLEQGIKNGLDRRLELFLEEIKDINKIRRLGKETGTKCPS